MSLGPGIHVCKSHVVGTCFTRATTTFSPTWSTSYLLHHHNQDFTNAEEPALTSSANGQEVVRHLADLCYIAQTSDSSHFDGKQAFDDRKHRQRSHPLLLSTLLLICISTFRSVHCRGHFNSARRGPNAVHIHLLCSFTTDRVTTPTPTRIATRHPSTSTTPSIDTEDGGHTRRLTVSLTRLLQ